MKTKNAILGLVALLVSAGAAFASLTVVTPDYIHVQYAGDANFTCTVADTCAGTGNPCLAQIVVSGVSRTTPIYENRTNPTTCSVARQDSNPAAQPVTKSKVIIAAD